MIQLIGVAILACLLSIPAFAGAPPPSLSTSFVDIASNDGLTNEGCRNYGLKIMTDLAMRNIQISGANSLYGYIEVQGNGYAVIVRCQVEHHIVMLISGGPDVDIASKTLGLLGEAWNRPDGPDKKTTKH